MVCLDQTGRKMNKKKKIQFRYYQMKPNTYVFALQGEGWIREYGKEIDYLHFHNYLEVGYCIYGDGHMIIGEETLEYHGGEFTVIPKNCPHTTNSIPGTKSYWEYLFIDESVFLNRIFSNIGNGKRSGKLIEGVNSRMHFFRKEEYPQLACCILNLFEVMRKKEPFFMEEAFGILAAMLVKLARINDKREETAGLSEEGYVTAASSETITMAMEYIGRSFRENLPIEELAKYCHVSETHLRRLFSNHMKMGVLEYINLVRIREACEQLKKTDASVADIAYKCGFINVSTFNRNFKKITGKNPNSWRKSPENFERQILKYDVYSEKGW